MEYMLFLLRSLILDLDMPYKYSDITLNRVLLVSTLQVSQELSMGYSIDISTFSILPSTIDDDEPAQNLIILKAACLLQINQANSAAENSMLIKDAVGMVDNREFALHIVNLLKSGKNYCDIYQNNKQTYALYGPNGMGNGIGIMGPIRDFARDAYVYTRGNLDATY